MRDLTPLGWTLIAGYVAVVIVSLITVVVPEVQDAEAPEAARSPAAGEP